MSSTLRLKCNSILSELILLFSFILVWNNVFQRISVVIMRQSASELLLVSPVTIPKDILGNFLLNSLCFWLESALMGEVYITFLPASQNFWIAYSPGKLLPLPVGTATKILWPSSIASIAYF